MLQKLNSMFFSSAIRSISLNSALQQKSILLFRIIIYKSSSALISQQRRGSCRNNESKSMYSPNKAPPADPQLRPKESCTIMTQYFLLTFYSFACSSLIRGVWCLEEVMKPSALSGCVLTLSEPYILHTLCNTTPPPSHTACCLHPLHNTPLISDITPLL